MIDEVDKLLQLVDKLQQAGKVDHLQQACGVCVVRNIVVLQEQTQLQLV